MTTHDQGLLARLSPVEKVGLAQNSLRQVPEVPFADCTSSLGSQIAGWLATAADYYAAGAVYQQLSRLSDRELQRRGLSRTTLASDICQACDRANL
jgi:hypothetical protein